jgi:hypothetical protein
MLNSDESRALICFISDLIVDTNEGRWDPVITTVRKFPLNPGRVNGLMQKCCLPSFNVLRRTFRLRCGNGWLLAASSTVCCFCAVTIRGCTYLTVAASGAVCCALPVGLPFPALLVHLPTLFYHLFTIVSHIVSLHSAHVRRFDHCRQ